MAKKEPKVKKDKYQGETAAQKKLAKLDRKKRKYRHKDADEFGGTVYVPATLVVGQRWLKSEWTQRESPHYRLGAELREITGLTETSVTFRENDKKVITVSVAKFDQWIGLQTMDKKDAHNKQLQARPPAQMIYSP